MHISRSGTARWAILLSALATFPAAADIGPPVKIKMPVDTPQAVAGQEYAGVFEIHVGRPGRLGDFAITGSGWTIHSTNLAALPDEPAAGVFAVPFKATPGDADQPIEFTMTWNGRRVAKSYLLGPRAFAARVAPSRSSRIRAPQRGDAELMNLTPDAPGGNSGAIQIQFVGRIGYMRRGIDVNSDGDTDDPNDTPPIYVGADTIGTGGPLPCMTFVFDPAPDDVTGTSLYSYQFTNNPAGVMPDTTAAATCNPTSATLRDRRHRGQLELPRPGQHSRHADCQRQSHLDVHE